MALFVNFLNLIITEVNNLLRDKDLEEADAALTYLYEQLDGVTQSDIRLSIATLIENQLRTEMFANIRQIIWSLHVIFIESQEYLK